MMINNEKHTIFLNAIHEKLIVNVTVDSHEKGTITRDCIPFDFGPWRRQLKENPERYHFYDLDSPDRKHNLSIEPYQLTSITLLKTTFNPADYVKWSIKEKPWFVQRDWGIYS